MYSNKCSQVLEEYLNFIQEGFQCTSVGSDCVITTPFLNAEFAPIEIYVSQEGNLLRLSDEGEVAHQLFINGIEINGNKEVKDAILLAASVNEITYQNSELFLLSNIDRLGESLHRLVTTIQAISYLNYKINHRVSLKFDDEVEKILISNRVTYENKIALYGQANRHVIPFFVNSNRNILISPLTATSLPSARTKAKQVAYSWLDLSKKFGNLYRYTVVVDDKTEERKAFWADDEAKNALFTYSTYVFYWTNDKDGFIETITA